MFISPTTVWVSETAPLNSVIMTVKAFDKDEGRNGHVEYQIIETAGGMFSLGTIDGLLRVSGTFIVFEIFRVYV